MAICPQATYYYRYRAPHSLACLLTRSFHSFVISLSLPLTRSDGNRRLFCEWNWFSWKLFGPLKHTHTHSLSVPLHQFSNDFTHPLSRKLNKALSKNKRLNWIHFSGQWKEARTPKRKKSRLKCLDSNNSNNCSSGNSTHQTAWI